MTESAHLDEPVRLLELALDGRPRAALDQLQPLMHAGEPDPRLWRAFGIALGMCDRVEEAVPALRRALEIAPGDVWSRAYLGVHLQALGRIDEADDIFGSAGDVIETRLLPDGEPAAACDEFHLALIMHILRHPSLTWEAPYKATSRGWQTDEFLGDDAPAVRRLHALLQARVHEITGEWGESGGAPGTPCALSMAAWGVVMGSGGSQKPHVHPAAVISGVYYLQVPPLSDDAGALCFRRTLPWIRLRPVGRAGPSQRVRPEVGKLVLFPSHLWHETLHFDSPGQRISIAFDVLPPRP